MSTNKSATIPKSTVNFYHDLVEISDTNEVYAIEAVVIRKIEDKVSSFEFAMNTSNCTVIFVDLGTAIPGAKKFHMISSVPSVAETIVLGGIFNASAQISTRNSDGMRMSTVIEFHGEGFEGYTAFGQDLHSAVQILDPAHFALYFESKTTSEVSKSVDVRAAILSRLDLTLSMRNLALMNAIASSLSGCICDDDEKDEDSRVRRVLSSNETDRVEELASTLETEDDECQHGIEVTPLGVESDTVMSKAVVIPDAINSFAFKLTTSEVQVTVVNDLQGLDEALLRISTQNFVASGNIMDGARITSDLPPFMAFSFTFHTSILSDYFDAESNSWRYFLVKPWEITLNGRRGPNELMPSTRPSTIIDIESLPCHISFSEQFLMNLASANRMWAVFSAASSSAIEGIDRSVAISKGLRRIMWDKILNS
jgi:hypothetical protein